MKLKEVDLDFIEQWGEKIGPTGIAIYHVMYLFRDAKRQPYRREVAKMIGCCRKTVVVKIALRRRYVEIIEYQESQSNQRTIQ